MAKNQPTGCDRWSSISSIGTRVVHPFKENLAFGRLLIPVVTRQIQDPDPDFRKRAMHSLKEALYDPKKVACLNHGEIRKAFQKLADDKDEEIRALLAEIFVSMTTSSIGKGFFVSNNLFEQSFSLLSDCNARTRYNACKTLSQIVLTPMGITALIDSGGIPKLVRRVKLEPMINQAIILQVLHCCTAAEPRQAVEEQSVEIILPFLMNPSASIREYAAAVLMDLGADADLGRKQIVELGGIPLLVNLCNDEEPNVVAKALGALMTATACTPGKLAAVEYSAVEKLLPLLKMGDLEIRLNCLKVLTSLAEAPDGRRSLKANIGALLYLRRDSSFEVQRCLDKAVAVIKVVPMW